MGNQISGTELSGKEDSGLKSSIIIGLLEIAYGFGMIVYAWRRKWLETHPREPGERTETDAVITAVTYQKAFLRPKEKAPARITVQYVSAAGKTVYATLPTVPLRFQIEAYAPELQSGANVRILYEPKHPHTFYFADPRYAAPEVSGAPRRMRVGWFGLTVITLLFTACMAFYGFCLYLGAQST